MLRIIESCVVKMENREIKKGDRIDDKGRKICFIGGSVLMMQWGDYSVLMENEKNIKSRKENAKKSDPGIRRKIK